MSTVDAPPVDVELVNKALDELRFRERVASDAVLAERYDLSAKTVSFLRRGKWTRTDRILIDALSSLLQNRPSDIAA